MPTQQTTRAKTAAPRRPRSGPQPGAEHANGAVVSAAELQELVSVLRAAKRGGVARGRCDVADRQRGNSQRRTDLTGQTVGGSFADTPPVRSTGALVGRALREPGRAVTYGLALAKGYWYRVILRILGRRFRAGTRFRVFGRLSVRGLGEVVFGDNVATWGRVKTLFR